MNKRLIIVGILILAITGLFKTVSFALKNIKIDEFHKSAIIFLVDSSESNQKMLPEEIKYLKTLCANLDPEDEIKILKVSDSSYLIYEGSPGDTSGITKALNSFTKKEGKDYGTDYAQGLKKAFNHCLTMKKEGYVPAIVVIGDLDEGTNVNKKINWDVFPKNVKESKKYMPDLTMMFVYAHPQKLDMVKTKLSPVLGEKKLIVANKENVDKANRRFIEAIGR